MNAFTRNISLVAAATAMITFGSVSAARAQDGVTAKVPFSFMVGSHRLPAGTYTISTLPDDPAIVVIESASGSRMMYRLTVPWSPENTPTSSKLQFVKLGHEYFLSRIAPQGGEAREIPLTPKAMERDMIQVEDAGGGR